jgi:hypothetical protein
VPVAFDANKGVTVAVRVTLVPEGAVVIAVPGEAASPIFSAVVVAVAVAWALVMAASENMRRIARPPQPFRMLVNVASAALRVVAIGMDPVLSRIFFSALADLFRPFLKGSEITRIVESQFPYHPLRRFAHWIFVTGRLSAVRCGLFNISNRLFGVHEVT